MSIAQYGKTFPILLRMQNPRGHVELLETIGKGNYGYVYKGKLTARNELAAVKVVFLKEDEIRETLLEMEILQACKHPNITSYYGCFLKGLDLWICMEFCGAGAVDSLYRAFRKPIPEDCIAAIIYESLLALEYLHKKAALIHRDIKAGNLLLTMNGQVKLADFGVSAQLKTIGGRANTFIGTPYWMAPEVIMCDPDNPASAHCAYTDKSDIWSVGITCIEIAEKNPPLSDIHPMQALTLIPKSDIGFAKPKNFSKTFVDFVNFLMVKNPDKRPSATDALAHPFMVNAKSLDRQKVLTDIVTIAQKIKEKKKQGLEITSEDEEDGRPPKVSLTLKQAKSSIAQIAQNAASSSLHSSNSSAELETAPSMSEFSTIVNNVQEGVVPVFEPVILTTLNEALTADVLDGQYILIGTERGLSYLDLLKPSMKIPQPLIQDIRFRQIHILAEYNVLVALSGKHDHIRQYTLSSIRKLILYTEGNQPSLLAISNATVPIQKIQIGKTETSEYDYLNRNQETDPDVLVKKWTDDYIKLVNTRDTRSFSVEQTESTAYLCMLGQGITLFRWAVEPYNRFMKIKSFWVPETPKFVSIAQDGLNAVDLFVGYSSELNRVSISDSKVSEIRVHREMKTKMLSKSRWQNILQIPYSDAKLEQLLRENAKTSDTTNRKLAAVAGPTLKRANTMTESYFLGTYHRLTKVVDEKGHPMIGAGVGGWKDGVMWSEAPVLQILRPLQNVISVGKNSIEIVDWKSAVLKQRLTVDEGSSFRFLSLKHGSTLLVVDKKRKGSMLYWMREATTPPRQAGSILNSIIKEQAPVNLLDETTNELQNVSLHDQKGSPKANPSNLNLGKLPGESVRPLQGPPPADFVQRPTTPTKSGLASSPPRVYTQSAGIFQGGSPYGNKMQSQSYMPGQAYSRSPQQAYAIPVDRPVSPSFMNGTRSGPPRVDQYRAQEYRGQNRPQPDSNLQRSPTQGTPPIQYQRSSPQADAYYRSDKHQRPVTPQGYGDPRYYQGSPRDNNLHPMMASPPRPGDRRFASNPDMKMGNPTALQQQPGGYQDGYDQFATLNSLYTSYTSATSTAARSDAGYLQPQEMMYQQQYDSRYQAYQSNFDPRYGRPDQRQQQSNYQQLPPQSGFVQSPSNRTQEPYQKSSQAHPEESRYQKDKVYVQGPPPPSKD